MVRRSEHGRSGLRRHGIREDLERLLAGDIGAAFFERVLAQVRSQQLLSSGPFTVNSTLIEAWRASRASPPLAAEIDGRISCILGLGGRLGLLLQCEARVDDRARGAAVPQAAYPRYGQKTTRRRSAMNGRTPRHASCGVS